MGRKTSLWMAVLLAAGSCLTTLAGSASGAGFALLEQSVRGMGTAYAGGAASAEDASTVFYNPAGLTRLSGSQAIAGLHTIIPSARFKNEGSTHLTGGPLRGTDGGEAGTLVFVPNLYYGRKMNDRLSAGLGIFSPFGFKTEYDPSWVGRYHGVESDVKTVSINPALACRATGKLSLGAGINLQYIRAKLRNAIDFGTIFASLGVPGMLPQGNDGFVTLKGDSWAWGYNLGALYELSKKTRAGIAYRSRIKQKVEGEADFSGVPSPNPTGRFLDTGIKAEATLPDTLSLSFWQELSRELAIMADITWTGWQTFDEIRVRFDNPAESDTVITTQWENTFRYAVGAVYMPGQWALRAGVLHDRSPVPDPAHGTPLIPDSDRTWLTLGLGYELGDTVSLHTGYAHLFVKDPEIRKSATGEDRLRGGLSGFYESRVDIVSVELAWAF